MCIQIILPFQYASFVIQTGIKHDNWLLAQSSFLSKNMASLSFLSQQTVIRHHFYLYCCGMSVTQDGSSYHLYYCRYEQSFPPQPLIRNLLKLMRQKMQLIMLMRNYKDLHPKDFLILDILQEQIYLCPLETANTEDFQKMLNKQLLTELFTFSTITRACICLCGTSSSVICLEHTQMSVLI